MINLKKIMLLCLLGSLASRYAHGMKKPWNTESSQYLFNLISERSDLQEPDPIIEAIKSENKKELGLLLRQQNCSKVCLLHYALEALSYGKYDIASFLASKVLPKGCSLLQKLFN